MKKCIIASTIMVGASVNAMTAHSWLVAENDHIVSGKNTDAVRSIASITKLVTAMVYLDDVKYPDKDLVYRAIVASDNSAARMLCQEHPEGTNRCIQKMNFKMHQLGLSNTKFVEPTGLSVFNVSTAEDLLKIVQVASTYPAIVEASNTPSFRYHKHLYRNTNPTISNYDTMISKTGFINKAGGCIVVMIKTENGTKTAIVLGSKNTKTRIPEVNKLLKN